MDWKQFFAAIVGSLAWPVSAIVVVFLLKAPLAKLLPKIRSFKYGELHVDLQEQLAEVKAEVVASAPETQPEEQPSAAPTALELAAISPRSSVLMSWLEVEKKLNELAAVHDLVVTMPGRVTQPLAPYAVMKRLYEQKKVDHVTYNTFRKLSRVRNEAVHMSSREIDFDEAVSMAEMCQWLTNRLQKSIYGLNEH